ncbi:hypothetical protein [Lentisalinibacter orientalis]|uniref:hypothetical protein n=1 Tax=Lentisalinibacter orientalis TaxID=2992241 RepID=UPI00386E5FD0
MKRLIVFCAVVALCSMGRAATATTLQPWQGDPMELDGQMIEDDSILCSGSGCGPLLDSLRQEYQMDLYLLLNQPSTLDETATYTLAVSTEQLCERLEESKPKGCSSSTPPSVPGYDPTWQPNGCGVGGWRDLLLEQLASLALTNFHGDLDEPFPGVSFLPACNQHDYCYGIQTAKYRCDDQFHENLQGACAENTANATRTLCNSVAAAYFVAVTDHGDSAYDSAGEDLACAEWHRQMNMNECKAS